MAECAEHVQQFKALLQWAQAQIELVFEEARYFKQVVADCRNQSGLL